METLAAEGVDPADAMQQFADWVAEVAPAGTAPIFVGFNAVFDWMFVDDYFQRFLERNPFGHSALDIKSYYLGHGGRHLGAAPACAFSPPSISEGCICRTMHSETRATRPSCSAR